MSPNDLLRTLQSKPFRGFRLFLSDGSAHDVTHPEMMLLGVRTSVLFVPPAPPAENRLSADEPIKLDNLHITKTIPLAAIEQAG